MLGACWPALFSTPSPSVRCLCRLQEGGARVAAACLGDAEGRMTGQLLSKRAVVAPTGAGADASLAARVWDLTCSSLGVAPPGVFGQ